MAELKWSPDGEKLFAKLMEAVPEAMRDTMKPKLMEMLASKAAGKAVSAKTVTRMVQEDLPEPQKSALLAALGIKKPETRDNAQPAAESAPSLEWSGKSKAMFEIMLGEVPEAMREVFRGKLTGVISEKTQGAPVSEDHVTAVVKEIVPEPFKSNILKKFTEVGDFDINIIDDIIKLHGTSQDSLMYILQDIQDDIGYLPVEALRAVSNKCDIPVSTIYNVVTFYNTFRLDPPRKHHVKLCGGTACHLKDTGKLTKGIEEKVSGASNTTLEKTLCLGCCDCAPVVEIDGKLFKGDDAKDKIDSVLT
jgi:NADH-quinone oxidoreductase subunit E